MNEFWSGVFKKYMLYLVGWIIGTLFFSFASVCISNAAEVTLQWGYKVEEMDRIDGFKLYSVPPGEIQKGYEPSWTTDKLICKDDVCEYKVNLNDKHQFLYVTAFRGEIESEPSNAAEYRPELLPPENLKILKNALESAADSLDTALKILE